MNDDTLVLKNKNTEPRILLHIIIIFFYRKKRIFITNFGTVRTRNINTRYVPGIFNLLSNHRNRAQLSASQKKEIISDNSVCNRVINPTF